MKQRTMTQTGTKRITSNSNGMISGTNNATISTKAAVSKSNSQRTRGRVVSERNARDVNLKAKNGESVAVPKKSMVTLTQAEFDAILSTIGKLTKEQENYEAVKGKHEGRQNIDLREEFGGHHANQDTKIENQNGNFNKSSATSIANANQSNAQLLSTANNPLTGIPRGHLTVAEKKRLEAQQMKDEADQNRSNDQHNFWLKGGGTVGTNGGHVADGFDLTIRRPLHKESEQEAPEWMTRGAKPEEPRRDGGGMTNRVTFSDESKSMTLPLTRAEKKRLQWMQEQAEENSRDAYDPWGRGGCGAPLQDENGSNVRDFRTRQDVHKSMEELTDRRDYRPPQQSYSDSMSRDVLGHMSRSERDLRTNDRLNTYNADNAELPPAAIRSVFSIGSLAPDENRFTTAQEKQKQDWLNELAKQREEQRQRQGEEKLRRHAAEPVHWMGDPSGAGPPKDKWAEKTVPPVASREPPRVAEQKAEYNAITDVQESVSVAPSSFVRGTRGVIVDPETLKEHDKKRALYLENQEYLKQQIEERERRRKAEKQRELEQDLKLNNQSKPPGAGGGEDVVRDPAGHKIMARKQQPQDNDKVELEKTRMESLLMAHERARLEAERDKHQRWLSKLQQGHHDTSNFREPPGVSLLKEAHPETQRRQVDSLIVNGDHDDNTAAGTLNRNDNSRYLTRIIESPLLNQTPTGDYTLRKESSTQTSAQADRPSLALLESLTRDSTEGGIEYKDHKMMSHHSIDASYDATSNRDKKKVRVNSVPQRGARSTTMKMIDEGDNPELTDRTTSVRGTGKPKWGYRNTENKRALKQSEKDYTYAQRTEARLERQQALLKAANSSRIGQDAARAAANKVAMKKQPQQHQTNSSIHERNASINRTSSRPDVSPQRLPVEDRTGKVVTHHSPAVPTVRHRQDNHGAARDNSPSDDAYRYAVVGMDTHRKTAGGRRRETERHPSPPSVQHQSLGAATSNRHTSRSRLDRYADDIVRSSGAGESDFIPFIRSSNILNPVHADSPLLISREATEMDRARRGYQSVLQPGKYGRPMVDEDGRGRGGVGDHSRRGNGETVFGGTVAGADSRQGQILQQLSNIRRVLMEKQRELTGGGGGSDGGNGGTPPQQLNRKQRGGSNQYNVEQSSIN